MLSIQLNTNSGTLLMMAQSLKSTPKEYAPLPGRLYKGYILFWSVLTLGGFGFAFVMILVNGW